MNRIIATEPMTELTRESLRIISRNYCMRLINQYHSHGLNSQLHATMVRLAYRHNININTESNR